MTDKKEIVLIEIPDRDYDARTFIVRYIGFPNIGNERIQQRAWAILPESRGNPPIFPIYGQCIGWHQRGNDELLGLPYGGRLEDYALTFEEGVTKAYELAKKYALQTKEDTQLIEYTRYNGQMPEQENKDHWFWFQD